MTFFSCSKQEKPAISFYYWKTNYKLSTSESKILSENKVSKLYIRYFDIDLDNAKIPFPKAPIVFSQKPINFQVVPVIYIKNQVFLSKKTNISNLAQQTVDYIKQINKKNNIKISEIQLDCDWNLSSRTNYFEFIKQIKSVSNKKISATIRLHQIKYATQTGIPPADSGVLMYYNMSKIGANNQNSIYTKSVADLYNTHFKNYPLQLNVALPIFSWAIQIRDNKVVQLISKINVQQIEKDTNFVKQSKTVFQAKNGSYVAGNYIKPFDILKFESVSKSDLLEMANDLKSNLDKNPNEIIFFDLDQKNFSNYENTIYTQIRTCF